MRFMVIVKASKDSEAGVMPSTEMLTAMGKFNEEWSRPGSWRRARACIRPRRARGSSIRKAQGSVSRGPFGLTGDLVAGFWLINTKSLDEAIDWMKRAPFGPGDEIEIRQVFAAEDFGEALHPRAARAGRAAARAGREEIVLPRHSGAARRAEPGIRYEIASDSADGNRNPGSRSACPGMTQQQGVPPCDS